jgi:rod shape-determining protein MreB
MQEMKGEMNNMRLALDLGTSNFRAGICGRSDIISEPCVIAFEQDGETVIGTEAARMVGRNPDMIEVANPIKWGAIHDFGAVVQVMRHVVKTLLPSGFGRRFSLTVAVPSGLTQVERKAVEEAGKSAGAREVRLVNATVAAAWGAQLPIESPMGCLVVNLGAGVTEAAILSMQGIVDSRSLNTGGRSIDEAIAESIKREYWFLVGQLSAENLKQRCGEMGGTDPLEVKGRNLHTGLPDRLLVSRSIVDDQLETYCGTIVELIVQTLSTCPPELVGDIVERGIILVGGGAKVKGLVRKLIAHTEVPIIVAEEPETCVIRGLLRSGELGTSQTVVDRFFRTPGFLQEKKVRNLYKSIMRGNAREE